MEMSGEDFPMRRIAGVYATDAYLPELWWEVSLAPEGADTTRLRNGGVPFLINHERGGVVGRVIEVGSREAPAGAGYDTEYTFVAEVPDDPDGDGPSRAREYLLEEERGLRGRISLGFWITDVLEYNFDGELERLRVAWQLLEISDVSVPKDTAAGIGRSGLAGPRAAAWDVSIAPEAVESLRSLRREHGFGLRDMASSDTISTEPEIDPYHRGQEDDMVTTESIRDEGDMRAPASERMPDDEDVPDDYDSERPGDHEDNGRADEPTGAPTPERPPRRQPPVVNDDAARTLPSSPALHPARISGQIETRDLDLGMYMRAALDPSRWRRDAARELTWMDQNLGSGIYRQEDGMSVIPFALLAQSGPQARRRAASRARQGIGDEEYLERYMPLADEAYRELQLQEELRGMTPEQLSALDEDGLRTMTQATTSAGAATSTMVDLARSIMWLTEMDRALDMMTVVVGLSGQWAGFFGNAKPTVSFPGEGNDLAETTPTLTQLTRLPVTMGMHWKISTAQMASASAPISALIEAGCEEVFRTQAMRAFLSGNRNAPDFKIQSNSFNGLTNSGLAETGFGAALSDLNRDDMVDARRRLFASEVDMMDLGWILSNGMAGQLEKTRIGGTESVRFVYEDGRVDSGAERVPARDSVHLGKTTGNSGSEVAVNDVGVLLQRSAALCLIWGAGISFNGLQIPGRTAIDYDLQIQSNFAFINPARGTLLKRGA